MRLLTTDADLRCNHALGRVQLVPTQTLVQIDGVPVLVRNDSHNRPIKGCPPIPPLKPCLTTIAEIAGRSDFVRINRVPVLLDTVGGLTSGDPPGTIGYGMRSPGQTLVRQA